MQRILADGSAIVLDTRKRAEYLAGHIAGAKNVAPPADSAGRLNMSLRSKSSSAATRARRWCSIATVRTARPAASSAEQLVGAGFTNVRRYQLGLPMWRTMSGPVEIELEGMLRVYKVDQTAVFFDGRSADEFAKTEPARHPQRSGRQACGRRRCAGANTE